MSFVSQKWADVSKSVGCDPDDEDDQPVYDNITVKIEILLPHGLFLTINVQRDDSIKKLMQTIWTKAKQEFDFLFTRRFVSYVDFHENWSLFKLGYPIPVPIDEVNTRTVAEIDAFINVYKLEQRDKSRLKPPDFPIELFGDEFAKQFHLDIGQEGYDFVKEGEKKRKSYEADVHKNLPGCISKPPLPSRPSFRKQRPPRTAAQQEQDNIYFTFSIIDVIIPQYSGIIKNGSDLLQITVDIHHGSSNLSCQQTKITCQLEQGSNGNCRVKRKQDFIQGVELAIKEGDIPRNAKLTFTVSFGQAKKESSSKYWVNLPVYDHKKQMVNQLRKLPMWEWNYSSSVNFQPQFGTNIANPDQRMTPILQVAFKGSDYDVRQYPSTQDMIDAYLNTNPPIPPILPESLIGVLMKDQLEDIDENDKKNAREAAEELMERQPNILPRILCCFQWERREHVAKIRYLLSRWPPVSLRTCLELLHCSYPDYQVRSFAVQRLRQLNMSDDEFNRYMLQLIQALQFEPNLDNDLVWYILERSVGSQVVWHRLFWLLRSEMHRPSVAVRFGLIMQCYFKFCPLEMTEYREETKMCQALYEISSELSNCKNDAQLYIQLKTLLEEAEKSQKLKAKHLPVTMNGKLKRLRRDQCKVMMSKKRPLKLNWDTDKDKSAVVFFKRGDDLKQDMLALQLLDIMDQIWKDYDLDCRVESYGCVTVGDQQGFIECVQEAETLADIQGQVKRGILNSRTLLDYLKKHNRDESSLNEAITKFRRTCAKYCVATYVLGVGDRHNDNLMLKQNGQFFHIDFGHILGDFKKIGGYQYERSPFVFHTQFLEIIRAGPAGDQELHLFHKECISLYKIIREQGAFLVSLLLLMLYSGAPNLQTSDDIDYIRNRLMLNRSWEEAEKTFTDDLVEHARRQNFAQVKWLLHSIKQRKIKKNQKKGPQQEVDEVDYYQN